MKRAVLILLTLTLIIGLCACTGESGADAAQSKKDEKVSRSGEDSRTTTESLSPGQTERPGQETGSIQTDKPGDASSTAQTGKPVDPPAPASLNIKLADWASVEWTEYTSPYFTLRIPKGWEVNWQGNAQQLYWSASAPGEAYVGISNLDHRYAAKDYRYMQAGGSDMYLVNGTVREFFETFYSNYTEYFDVKNSCTPSNLNILLQVRPDIRDYSSLYVQFKENGIEGEGVYSAAVMQSRDVWFNGMNYGMWEINGIVTEWARLGELTCWQPILTQIAQSFTYTSYYVQEWRSVLGTNASPEAASTDSVVEAFEERSLQDTILQEKRSDMIGEYERVIDNETGNIYRAYNGFLDDMGDQTRYSGITDNQYADGFVGWIDKFS